MELLVLLGKSYSGKTTKQNKLVGEGYERVVTCTTRPKRPEERDEIDYRFVSYDEYLNDINNKELVSPRKYLVANGEWWTYYVRYSELISSLAPKRVMILDFEGYKSLFKYLENSDIYVHAEYLDVPLEERMKRVVVSERENINPKETLRRLYFDEFKDFNELDSMDKNQLDELRIEKLFE